MNTSLAAAELVKFVTKLNRYIAADKLTKDMADGALPTLNKIMDILGLKIVEASEKEREEIEEVVVQRNKLRAEKKFAEADEIRKKLLERSVDLLDHKGRTVWVKREKSE
jgi:cysteinyl-tRNA synthetase